MIVTIIGSGNVGTVLGRRLFRAGHTIEQVFSRTFINAQTLADELSAQPVTALSGISMSADIYILCVSDQALENLSPHLSLASKLVVHTAGAVSIEVLKPISENFGVLYPLQTIRKELPEIAELPVLVDANDAANRARLVSFAQSFTETVCVANDDQRKKLHLAAVVVNNFTNYLFTLAEDYCKKEGVEFKLLLPLLQETVSRLHLFSSAEVQTGPAARGDESTIQKHLGMLEGYADLKGVYEQMTRRIRTQK